MSEQYLQDCRHCPGGLGLRHPLFFDRGFWVVCDPCPLVEGHILIITEEHVSCMGALPDDMFAQYKTIFEWVERFLREEYGSVAAFEHGVLGQTIFHAHTHLLPFDHTINDVVPEQDRIRPISELNKIREEFRESNRYLYVGEDTENWLVDPSIGSPRFFRDRFAKVLNAPSRGNWKTAQNNPELVKEFEKEIQALKRRWKTFRQHR